ncbi:amidohydrolase family protein [Bacillus sp. Marseille-P3661]|uniref:amidohydrolase family protein n=1 Tax=Bacillus sp. Marseille-P3661 TaxID=1936234 RepID=UPI000C851E8D
MNKPRIIDTDVHNALVSREELLPYLPKAWHQQWLDIGSGINIPNTWWSPVGVLRKDAAPENGGAPASDPEYLLKDHFDRYGIDIGILTSANLNGISIYIDPDFGNAVASAYNDLLIEKWLPFDSRFKGSLLINNSDPIAAAKEIDRVGGHPDIVQVIMCSAARIPYGQRFYHPIYEAAERHGLPVAIHPGTEGLGIAGPPTPAGYPTRYVEYHNMLPINYMAHVNSLVCEGVFEKFPTLKFVAIEGGVAWLPHLMWRMDKNHKALRDQVPWLKKFPSEYIKEHIRLTTQPIEESHNPRDIVELYRMCGADDIAMYSSDYPHWDFDNPNMVFAPFPKDMKEKLLWKNANDLYGFFDEKVINSGEETPNDEVSSR